MGKRYPQEFRDDVVRVARKREAPIRQIAKDFGVGEPTLYGWLADADKRDGVGDGEQVTDSRTVRELEKRNRLLEMENEVLRRAAIYLGKGVLPK